MLIGQVCDSKERNMNGSRINRNNDYHEYETADELFEIMTENHQYNTSSTAGDLVILYKNLDIGSNIMSEGKYSQTQPTNQYVETVVYHDDQESDESDIGEIYSTEDIRDVMMINKERIDLLNNTSSHDNNLCHKHGHVAIDHSNLNASYNKQFIFKDPFIKDQLNSCIPNDTNVLPTSLLDYICCKRLEDNNNFYMDSVITFVQHTIEHLKRISNGDYLSDKAKKKWREVVDPFDTEQENVKNPVVANSISIPLHVVSKLKGKSELDDIAHSEVDVRSLSKLLEKKIVLEIPKLIRGTFQLFSKYYKDNVIISCKGDSIRNETLSRVDVVVKLKETQSRHVMRKLNSIMILPSSSKTSIKGVLKSDPLPALLRDETDYIATVSQSPKIVELKENEVLTIDTYEMGLLRKKSEETYDDSLVGTDTDLSSMSSHYRNNDFAETFPLFQNVIDKKICSDEQTEANFRVTAPNELLCNVQRLNMNSPVPEEGTGEVSIKKKKSGTKIRIKSPYENSSHAVEEKKRTRLLEIRERRENRKKALSENCKISKHKYAKGAIMAQASNSVTKLSITNKSFYNSIYGQNGNNENKITKITRKPHYEDLKIVVEMESCEDEPMKSSPNFERNMEKYINHSYYLDNADTEVMHVEMKQMSDTENTTGAGTASTSGTSDDFGTNLNIIKDYISAEKLIKDTIIDSSDAHTIQETTELFDNIINVERSHLETIESTTNIVPTNSPKETIIIYDANKTSADDCKFEIECCKSINEIYDIMKIEGRTEKHPLHVDTNDHRDNSINKSRGDGKIREDKDMFSIQPTDSGTSIKHNLTSSIPSCFSFEKTNDDQSKKHAVKRSEIPVLTTPKVLKNIKSQSSRTHDEKLKREQKKANSPVKKIYDNPLKAISQLLHEFDNIKKNRHKNESKPNKKHDTEHKNAYRQVTFKKPLHQEQHSVKESEPVSVISSPKVKKSRQTAGCGSRPPSTKISTDEKHSVTDKFNRKKVSDLIDEVKEARGEAVRGPPKTQSRLDSLAQPKKSYLHAHSEQYQLRNNRHINVTNKPRITNTSLAAERKETLSRVRPKKISEVTGSQKPNSTVPPLGYRRSLSSSPDGNHKASPALATAPSHKPNVPPPPEKLMKKMITVESYVNNHYGCSSSTRDFNGAQKSRVPLIPTDLDIGSVTSSPAAEESTALGNKLHHMIDTMINTVPPKLTSVREKETLTSKENLNEPFMEDIDQFDEFVSNTEFPIDVFGDKSITTAVASFSKDKELKQNIFNNNIGFISYDIQPTFNSTTELERLENALYRRLSAGAFQKRLRIKQLTLTPKHSLQQVLVLHSGDAGSVVVKSTLSQNLAHKKSKTSDLYKPTSSYSHFDWTFANFPQQVATVAYATPSIKREEKSRKLMKQELKFDNCNTENSNSTKSDLKSNKTIQCFKGCPVKPIQEQAIQVNEVVDNIKPIQFEILRKPSSLTVNIDGTLSEENVNDKNKNLVTGERESSIMPNKNGFPKITNLDNTTSLDVLVGLLNEIKNITSCQTYITKHENKHNDTETETKSKELEFILKNAELLEGSDDHSPQNVLSYDSLGVFNQHNLPIRFLPYLKNVPYEPIFFNSLPMCQDKEVNVNISGVECTHTFTEVPSCFLPITVHHSTHVTSSLIGVISEPSEQSIYSFSDYQTLYCNSSFDKIIELPNVDSNMTINVLRTGTIENNNDIRSTEINLKCDSEKRKNMKLVKNNVVSSLDTHMRIKRDILVTVYSILVMTVFASLSFAEILYRS